MREPVFVNHPNDKPYFGEICLSEQNRDGKFFFSVMLPSGEIRERIPSDYVYEANDKRVNEMIASRCK